ncbi:MAG: 3'-5' exonuclease [Chloroflexaceae bacterium]|nr:3'-5' exonuclease [Chloroflexaceae bacterium]
MFSLFPWQATQRAHLPPCVEEYLATSRPVDEKSWRDVSYSVLDLETTGLIANRDVILSIGLVEIDQGRIHLERNWYSLVQPPPDVQVPAESICIHKLMHCDLVDAPALREVLLELLARLRGRVLVVHFAQIDIEFLKRALRKLWGVPMQGPAIDTMRIAQMMYQQDMRLMGEEGMGRRMVTSLSELAEDARLPIYEQHNALTDALTTAQLFLAQATRLERRGMGTLRGLLRAGRCLR